MRILSCSGPFIIVLKCECYNSSCRVILDFNCAALFRPVLGAHLKPVRRGCPRGVRRKQREKQNHCQEYAEHPVYSFADCKFFQGKPPFCVTLVVVKPYRLMFLGIKYLSASDGAGNRLFAIIIKILVLDAKDPYDCVHHLH